MIIEVDTTSAVPPFEQIRAQVTTMILSGVLPACTQLPTIRQLAADLGLAPGTVARAYRELEGDELVTSRVRHGTTVIAAPLEMSRAVAVRRLTEAAHTYAVLAQRLGIPVEDAAGLIRDALEESDADAASG